MPNSSERSTGKRGMRPGGDETSWLLSRASGSKTRPCKCDRATAITTAVSTAMMAAIDRRHGHRQGWAGRAGINGGQLVNETGSLSRRWAKPLGDFGRRWPRPQNLPVGVEQRGGDRVCCAHRTERPTLEDLEGAVVVEAHTLRA